MRHLAPVAALCGALLLLAAPASARSTASWDLLGGAPRDEATWSLGLQVGWPWSGLRAQVGLGKGFSLVGEADAALLRRFQPSGGLAWTLASREKGRLSIELLIGGQAQIGLLPQQGPSGLLRARLMGILGPVAPYLLVGTRHTLLFDRVRILSQDPERAETTVTTQHRWSPFFSAGVGFALSEYLGLDLGVDWHFVDVGHVAVSIPGIHIGLQIGGPR